MKFRIHPAGYGPLTIVALMVLVLSAAAYFLIPPSFLAVSIALWTFLLVLLIWAFSFFRYPDRKAPATEPGALLSAADGKVVVIEKIETDRFPEGEALQISVFMSIYSVHLNYVPMTGTITSVNHRNGLHLMAIKPKASLENEQCETVILSPKGQQIIIRQIAGAAARRVLSFLQSGQSVQRGDELGYIRFGSRVDHIIPVSSQVLVKPGDMVKACTTILAVIQ